MKIIDLIKKDYIRSSRNKRALVISSIYRLGNSIYYSNLNKITKRMLIIILRLFQKIFIECTFNVFIPFKTQIGKGLRLCHANGIVIHPNAVIGENCTIFQQVTIGANEHKHDFDKAPIIGDNVYIGAGAKIIGNINIRNGVKIGANAVLTKSVEENITVVEFNKILNTNSERKGII